MDSVLREIQFLANSANRIRALDALRTGTKTRRDLQEKTGIPRSTVARILDDAESRGWVSSEGSQYRTTAFGEAMVSEFLSYVETVEGIHHLGEAVNWLPEPVHDLEFHHFRDATITTASPDNPASPFDRGLDLINAADEYRGLTATGLPQYVSAIQERAEQGELTVDGVIESRFIESIRDDSERAPPWRALAGNVWTYDGRIPINMHIVDRTVLIWLGESDEEIAVKGLLESENPTVVSWAESLHEEYRAEAEPLDPDALLCE